MKLFALHMGRLYHVEAVESEITDANTTMSHTPRLSVLGITEDRILLVDSEDLGVKVPGKVMEALLQD